MRPLVRSSDNPIITTMDLPRQLPGIVDSSSVFNPGAVRWGDRYMLMLRVQTRGRRTHLVMAESRNGREFSVWPDVVRIPRLDQLEETIYHVYDPRITPLDDEFLVMFAADTETGCRLGTARTRDFRDFEFIGLGDHPDIRNGVILPSRFGDRYLRYDRPNRVVEAGAPATGDEALLFRFSGDCWIEIRNGADELIYADLRREGDELAMDGLPPFQVLVGDAQNVELLYLGEPFDITPRPGRALARFTVGEQ